MSVSAETRLDPAPEAQYVQMRQALAAAERDLEAVLH
jgi:hypothetical protein